MAKYKSQPNYELIQPGLYVHFDFEGHYETSDKREVEALDKAASESPFIKRVDEQPKPAEKSAADSEQKDEKEAQPKPRARRGTAKKD
jgi:hypothetical protein